MGGLLLFLCIVGVAAFISWLKPQSPPQLFVESLTVSGYVGPSGKTVEHLPLLADAEEGAKRYHNILRTSALSTHDTPPGLATLSKELREWAPVSEPRPGKRDTTLLLISGHAIVTSLKPVEGIETPGVDELVLLTSEYNPIDGVREGSVPLSKVLENICTQREGIKIVLLDIFQLAPGLWLGTQHDKLFDRVEQAVQDLERDDLWVITACKSQQRSYDSLALALTEDSPRSLFEASLVETLGGKSLAGEEITIDSLYNKILSITERLSGKLQSPQLLHATKGRLDRGDNLQVSANQWRLGKRPSLKSPSEEDEADEGSSSQQDSTQVLTDKSTPNPFEKTEWWDLDYVSLEEDPWLHTATYSPRRFRSAMFEKNDKQRKFLEKSAEQGAKKAQEEIPVWELKDTTAMARRKAKQTLLLAVQYADSYTRLCEQVQPYWNRSEDSSDKKGLIEAVRAFIDAIEKASTAGKSSGGNQKSVAEKQRVVQQLLNKTLRQCLSNLSQSHGRWDCESELTVRAILDSRLLGKDKTEKAGKAFRQLLKKPQLASDWLSGKVRSIEFKNRLLPQFSTMDVLGLQRRLYQLGGYEPPDHQTAGNPTRPLTNWLHKGDDHEESSGFTRRMALQLRDPRSFGSPQQLIKSNYRFTELPNSSSFDTPIISSYLYSDGEVGHDVLLSSEESAPLELDLGVAGDDLPANNQLTLIAEYDQDLLEVRWDDHEMVSGEKQDVHFDRKDFRISLPLTIGLKKPTSVLKSRQDLTLEFPGLHNGKLVIRVFGEESPRALLAIQRRSYRNGKTEWPSAQDGLTDSLGIYPDIENHLRLQLTNLSSQTESYGVAVYAVRSGDNLPTTENLEQDYSPLAVSFVRSLGPDKIQTLSFGELPVEESEAADSKPVSGPKDAALLARLRELREQDDKENTSEAKCGTLVFVVYNKEGRSQSRLMYPIQIKSPTDYVHVSIEEYDRKEQTGKVHVALIPDVGHPSKFDKKHAIDVEVRTSCLTERDSSIGLDYFVKGSAYGEKLKTIDFKIVPRLKSSHLPPPLSVDIGSYRRAVTFQFDGGRGEWEASPLFGLRFLGIVGGKDGHTLLANKSICLVRKEDWPLFAKFACDFGSEYRTDSCAIKATKLEVSLNGDLTNPQEVYLPRAETISYLAKVKRSGNNLVFTARCNEILIPLANDHDQSSQRSFRRRVRVDLNGLGEQRVTKESFLVIADHDKPSIQGKPEFFRGSITVGETQSVGLSIQFMERHSGVQGAIFYWEYSGDDTITEDWNEEKESKILPVTTVSFEECTVSIPVDDLEASNTDYQLMVKLVDKAGNRSAPWTAATELRVQAPREIVAKRPATKKKSRARPKKKSPPKPHGLRVRILYETGTPVGSGRLTVSAKGPKSITLRPQGNGYWSFFPTPPGSYDVTVNGSITGSTVHADQEGVATSEDGKQSTDVRLVKGRRK